MKTKLLISNSDIEIRVEELALEIDTFYKDSCPIMICVLKGAVVFFADLVKSMNIDAEIDFIGVKSYLDNKSTGKVDLYLDLSSDITGRDVVIVEDIVDSGETITKLFKHINCFKPKSIRVVTLLNKPSNHKINEQIDWIGFNIKDRFVFGYGLDFYQKFRGLNDLVTTDE